MYCAGSNETPLFFGWSSNDQSINKIVKHINETYLLFVSNSVLMKTTIIILAIVVVLAGVAVTSLMPIHQVSARSGPPENAPNTNAKNACESVSLSGGSNVNGIGSVCHHKGPK